MRLFFRLFSLLLCLALPAAAQERPSTILVLDASGSMWGQIDGVNKIVIAREVVADLLADFPADQDLGLVAYGHNRRGDCADIETLVGPAPGSAAEIIGIVNALNPRGMTPMTDSVIAAAESLRYTENAATVILVSDGIETCNPDPCAAARVLEQTGVAFTAHVVGFDVAAEPEALAQMQCIADETGGMFLTADNAAELTDAMATVMTEVVSAPDPAPVAAPEGLDPVRTAIAAVIGTADGAPSGDPVIWSLTAADGAVIVDGIDLNPLVLDLPPGDYAVTATNTYDGGSAEADFTVLQGESTDVTLVLPALLPAVTLDAPASAPAGSTVLVGWTITSGNPDMDYDNVQVGLPDGSVVGFAYVRDGNPTPLVMPAEPGTYELRYKWRDRTVIARQAIDVTPADLALIAPDSAVAGSTVAVEWRGPNQQNDNIQIGLPDGSVNDYRYVSDGNPVMVVMPWQPGAYELRYRLQDLETILTQPITVTPGTVALDAPATGAAGTEIMVGWTGPDAQYDNIQIGSVGGSDYSDYAYTTDGPQVALTLPGTPGTYELRYQFRDREAILRQPITVTDQAAGLTLPTKLAAGQTVGIGWTGPGLEGDFIGIGRPGEGYGSWAFVRDGNPVSMTLPGEPGPWEIRYYLGTGETVLASVTVDLAAVSASLSAPGTAAAGGTVEVGWTGPGYAGDFIAIGRPGEGYANWVDVADGNPARLPVPAEPGVWELRYYMAAGERVLAVLPLTVTGK